jgi:hypothetical protein
MTYYSSEVLKYKIGIQKYVYWSEKVFLRSSKGAPKIGQFIGKITSS